MYWLKAPGVSGTQAQFIGLDKTEPISGRTVSKYGASGNWQFTNVDSLGYGDAMIRAGVINKYGTLVNSGLYVSGDGECGSHSPCYSTINNAYQHSGNGDNIKIGVGFYMENLLLERPVDVVLSGGWNDSYCHNRDNQSVICGTLTLARGAVTVDRVIIGNTVYLADTNLPLDFLMAKHWPKLAVLQ